MDAASTKAGPPQPAVRRTVAQQSRRHAPYARPTANSQRPNSFTDRVLGICKQISKPLFGRGALLTTSDDAFVAPWRTVDRETYELREELYKAQCEAAAFDQRQLGQEETAAAAAKAPADVVADDTTADVENTVVSAPSGVAASADPSPYESVFATARKLAERRATGTAVVGQASFKGKEADRSLPVATFDEEDEEDDIDFEPADAEGEDDEEEDLQRDMEPIDETEEVTTPAASANDQSSVATSSAASPSNSQAFAPALLSPSEESEPASELSADSEASDQSIELSVVEESSGEEMDSASESDQEQTGDEEEEGEVALPTSVEEPLESESPSESESPVESEEAVETESEPEQADVGVEVLEEEESSGLNDQDAVESANEAEASGVDDGSDVGSVDDESDQMTEEIATLSSSDELSESEAAVPEAAESESESEAEESVAAESEAEESVAESSDSVANESAPLSSPRSWWPFSGRSLFSGLGSAQKDRPCERTQTVHEAISDSSRPGPVKRKSDELLVVGSNHAQVHHAPPSMGPSAYARRRLPQRTFYERSGSPYVPASFIDVSSGGNTGVAKRARGLDHSELRNSALLTSRRHTSNAFAAAAAPSEPAPLSTSPNRAAATGPKRTNSAAATPVITAASLGLEARRSVARGRCQKLRRLTSVYYGSGYGSRSAPYTLNVALSAPTAAFANKPALTASAQESYSREDEAGARGGSITAQKILDIISEVPPTRSQASLESHDIINPYELSSPYSVRMRPATTQRRRVLVPLSTRLSQSSSADSTKTVTQHADSSNTARAIIESIQSVAPLEVQAGLGSALKAVQSTRSEQKRHLPPPLPTKKPANAPSPSAKKSAGAVAPSQSPVVASPSFLTKSMSSTSPSSLSARLAAKGQLAPKPLDQLAKDSTAESASQAPKPAFSFGAPKALPKAAEVEGATSTPPPPVTTIFGTPAPKLATKTAEVLPPKAPEAAAVPAARQGPSATTAALATSELRLPVFSFTLPAATGAVSSAAAKQKAEKLNVSQLPIFAFTLDIKTAVARGFSQLPSKPMQPSAQAKTSDWTCDVCELKSPLSAAQCIVCDAVRPVVKPDVAPSAPPATSSWISSEFRPVAPKDGEWVCDTCELKNPLAASKCTVCDAAKPEPKPAASSTAPVPNIWAQGGFNVAGPKDGEWVCDTCELKNPPAAPKCTICDAAKPGAPNTAPVPAASSAAPVPNIWAQSGFNVAGPKDGEWICDTCELKNPPAASKCTVCDAAKPAKTSVAPPTSSLTPLAKKKASDLDASQLPVFSFDLDVSKKPAFPRC
ncbi:hypothetical protein FBU31_003369 [Coemansia sp. 'formosensis']|nr:hypothetical protein FBU31_003369 [Coemansia sp. 'formosensis']